MRAHAAVMSGVAMKSRLPVHAEGCHAWLWPHSSCASRSTSGASARLGYTCSGETLHTVSQSLRKTE